MDSTLSDAKGLLERFKISLGQGDLQMASRLLQQLKLKLALLPALPPQCQPSPTAQEQLLLARDTLEHAVLLSVQLKDEKLFERNFLQLRPYYVDTRSLLPPSTEEASILGLNLLRLLVQNRIAEFHTELELLPVGLQESSAVRSAVELEQWLMEGAYARVLATRASAPHPAFAYFLDRLMATVRDEIAGCSERAYESLSSADAAALLMFSSPDDLKAYADKHDWEVKDGRVLFQQAAQHTSRQDIPSMALVKQALGYARELERIV